MNNYYINVAKVYYVAEFLYTLFKVSNGYLVVLDSLLIYVIIS